MLGPTDGKGAQDGDALLIDFVEITRPSFVLDLINEVYTKIVMLQAVESASSRTPRLKTPETMSDQD